MIAKIILSIYLLLLVIGLVLVLMQFFTNGRIAEVLCKIGLIILLVFMFLTILFDVGIRLYKLWG